ncbi:heme ABC transporter substrate-binding protein IsdE [Ruminococcus sp. AF37-20]|jgi:iron complex transport system substrate-binding protein|uniref:heme ABC transporter substrate-binding protein IsdE n=1 Tax=Ruminococcus sp. AF37-20 TaxID=2293178 RepID=UPI000E5557A4|nr:heme ABC transporter substrate-binding protein IsdE [Ruminococcus sp. AF37-20]MBD8912911.1 heme ABC transporter substrate-binding protein IsdE [Ruminococcus bicirculans (ex Wegman et al. 2014)]RGF46373.1 heme ABC transporter substrate-binding protein IsdE [Ruminococcus sp. AF37-20]
MKKLRIAAVLTAALMTAALCGCVDQHPEENSKAESGSVTNADDLRIAATSPAVADICDKLDIDLVGVCSSTVSTIPDRYKDATQLGTAMNPDTEILASLDLDWILSPSSLESDLQPKYAAIKTKSAFLNLKSVEGMYKSIEELGEMFDRQEQAQKLVDEYTSFMNKYKNKNKGKESPKVLVLMGLPGSYIVATDNSYVGSLVKLAGGTNVYGDGGGQEFLNANTEDMETKDPDIIVRCAHALPDEVVEMFNEEFSANDIWKHFRAVQEGKVYDLSYEYFGMSAGFDYPQALDELQPILYGDQS